MTAVRIHSVLLAVFLFATGTAGLVWVLDAQNAPTTLVIVHTNDIHGQILSRNGAGGMAEMAAVIRNIHPDLILDAGDMFTGTMLCDELLGRPLIDIMNRIGYQAVALGNHEFDYGRDVFRQRAREASFPILSANVDIGSPEVKPFTILTAKGVRVGVIGLTVEALAELTHPKNLQGVTVKNVVEALEQTLPAVRAQSDFVVLIAHLTQDEQIRVAKAFPQIRLILAGHPHEVRTTVVGSTLIAEAGVRGQFVGKVEVRLANKTPDTMISEFVPVQQVEPDPEIAAVVTKYDEIVRARRSEILGEASETMNRTETEECALCNLIADSLRSEAGTEIAIQNIGGIRSSLRKGPITYGDIFEVLPFQNTVVTLTLSGRQLRQVLSRRVLAISGLRVVWDPRRPPSERLVSATLADGSPIEDGQSYTVATNDFVAVGGDGLVEFTHATHIVDTGIVLRDLLKAAVRKHPVISGTLDGRLRILRDGGL